MTAAADITPFHDAATGTLTYLVSDPVTRRAAIIDPVLDFDLPTGRTATRSADAVLAALAARGEALDWILETHAHADHLSAAAYVQAQAGGRIAIGEGICAVQAAFAQIFGPGRLATDGSQFDHLFTDGERFHIGSIEACVLATPGHTPDSLTYLVSDAAFIGDTLFMPENGTARGQFIALREARDRTLPVPALIIPSVQINIRAGALPEPDSNGIAYLRIPLNVFGSAAPGRPDA